MPKFENLKSNKTASEQSKSTVIIQGNKGFENFAFIDVNDELLEEIRNAKELFRNCKITRSFIFKLKDTGDKIIEDAINVHEFH